MPAAMLLAMLLAQAAPVAVPTTTVEPRPCRMKGLRGKLIDVPPNLCEQSTWDKVRLAVSESGLSKTTMELDVDAAGRVTACRIAGPSGVPALDAKACTIAVEKARYRPATDAAGQPIATHQRLSVTWRAPD